VSSHPGGEHLKSCFACGACTGGCPASEVDPLYDPRKIIRMILLGMKDKVLSSDMIWLCSMCFTCSFHCPQDVQFVKVMGVLREMAVKEGYAKPSFLKNIQEIDRFSQTIRHHMVMSIVDKKLEDFGINPKDLLNQVAEKI
jgi:heterodisulfide reductase subunit C